MPSAAATIAGKSYGRLWKGTPAVGGGIFRPPTMAQEQEFVPSQERRDVGGVNG